VKHLKKAFEGVRAPAIDTPAVKAYVQQRQIEGAANATFNRELAALKRMLNLARRKTGRPGRYFSTMN